MSEEPRPLKVTLLEGPKHPLESLFVIWEQSRSNKALPHPEELYGLNQAGKRESLRHDVEPWSVSPYGVGVAVSGLLLRLGHEATPAGYTAWRRRFLDTVRMIMAEAIPVTENLFFVFHIENIPISLREQMVRHRIGHHFGENFGVDIIPELAQSTFWSQTSRVIPFNTFFDEGRYLLPEAMKGKNVQDTRHWITMDSPDLDQEDDRDYEGLIEDFDAQAYFQDTMKLLQHRYKRLMAAGVHIEDCRQIIPVGATHGITWGMNIKAALHVIGKRASWIAQIGLWEPLIEGIATELAKEHPILGEIARPACIKGGKYIGCPVNGTNVERVQGIDGMPPCPLWIRYESKNAVGAFRDYERQGKTAAWRPPLMTRSPLEVDAGVPAVTDAEAALDVLSWDCDDKVQVGMLKRTSTKFGRIWDLDVFNPGLEKG